MGRAFLGGKLDLNCARPGGGPEVGDGAQGEERLWHEERLRVPASAPTGVPPKMTMWSLLLLWGLATPCQGLLDTVGTLARIDKDELGKGEPGVDSL